MAKLALRATWVVTLQPIAKLLILNLVIDAKIVGIRSISLTLLGAFFEHPVRSAPASKRGVRIRFNIMRVK